VVSTDYTSWALMCTTSASLGGQKPAQVPSSVVTLAVTRRALNSHCALP
jgi:hypothetical protein